MVSRRQRANKSLAGKLNEHERKLEEQDARTRGTSGDVVTRAELAEVQDLAAKATSTAWLEENLGDLIGRPGTAPGIPSGLRVTENVGYYDTAQAMKSRVVLAWDASSLPGTEEAPTPTVADQYEIWSRKSTSSELTRDTSTIGTTSTIESWEPGMARLVSVRARYGAGLWSDFSAEIPVTPEAPEPIVPKTPTGFSVTSNQGFFTPGGTALSTVTYTWSAVTQSTGNLPIDIALYEVWERIGTAPWVLSTSTEGTTATLEYQAGVTREVRIRAVSRYRTYSEFSNALTITPEQPIAAKPKAPTGLQAANNIGSFLPGGRPTSHVTIKWTAVTLDINNNSVPVREYELVVREPVGTSGSFVEKPLGRTIGLEMRVETPTSADRNYFVRVISTFGVWSDNSAYLTVSGAVPIQNTTPPTAPIVTSNRGNVTVSWDGLITTGTVPAEFWQTRVQISYDAGTNWSGVGTPITSAGMGAVVVGTIGATVHARLIWVDSLGRASVPSVASAVVVKGVVEADLAQTIKDSIQQAQNDAIGAQTAADTAFSVAEGKNKAYYQDEEPDGSDFNIGDTWFNTGDNYKLSTWDGNLWVLTQDSASASIQAGIAQGLAEAADTKATNAVNSVGAAIAASLDEYVVTNSSSDVPGPNAGWDPDTPDWEPGQYIWRRTKNTHINGTVSYSAPVVITGADGTAGEDAVLLRVASSRGTSFKNNAISTVLTATVFKGPQQITNLTQLQAEFGLTAFLEWWWRRIDDSAFGVISSADPRLSQGGFALTVSPTDVDEQTVFQCILNT